MIRIKLTSVHVDDQAKPLEFYTEVLGLEKKSDFPAGEFRWLTVVSPEDPDGVELVLEPNDNPIARTYQEALFEAGMPAAVFEVDDIHKHDERITALGGMFRSEPTPMGPVTTSSCGCRPAPTAGRSWSWRTPRSARPLRMACPTPSSASGSVGSRRCTPWTCTCVASCPTTWPTSGAVGNRPRRSWSS
jgi:predicted enzyme related to lactoylglutathione lyase